MKLLFDANQKTCSKRKWKKSKPGVHGYVDMCMLNHVHSVQRIPGISAIRRHFVAGPGSGRLNRNRMGKDPLVAHPVAFERLPRIHSQI